jgi:hypothetical protein
MTHAERFEHHVAQAEAAMAAVTRIHAQYDQMIRTRFDEHPPPKGTNVEFVVDRRCEGDREWQGAKSARDRHLALATMHGLGAILDLLTQQSAQPPQM